jgi:hypothetical protein
VQYETTQKLGFIRDCGCAGCDETPENIENFVAIACGCVAVETKVARGWWVLPWKQ